MTFDDTNTFTGGEADREVKRKLGFDFYRAIVGDAAGLTTQGLVPYGLIRVRRRRGSGYGAVEYVRAFAGKPYPLISGVEVWVEYDPKEKSYGVTGATASWTQANQFDTTILNTGAPKYNAGWVDMKLALPLLTYAQNPPSVSVGVNGLVYLDDAYQLHQYEGEAKDLLTAYVPAAGTQRAVLIYLNSETGAAGVIASTATALPDSAEPLTLLTDVQECVNTLPPRSILAAVWRLQNNQSTIVSTDILEDLRQWLRPLPPRMKWNATTAPAVTDDSGEGYGVLSLWGDTTNDKVYVCLDATVGAG